jgi:hypothetical protein
MSTEIFNTCKVQNSQDKSHNSFNKKFRVNSTFHPKINKINSFFLLKSMDNNENSIEKCLTKDGNGSINITLSLDHLVELGMIAMSKEMPRFSEQPNFEKFPENAWTTNKTKNTLMREGHTYHNRVHLARYFGLFIRFPDSENGKYCLDPTRIPFLEKQLENELKKINKLKDKEKQIRRGKGILDKLSERLGP